MTFGSFHSSEPRLTEDITLSFFFNKSLQQRGLEYRLGNVADDIRYDIRLVGGALLTRQEWAAKRYEKAAHATTAAVERQTAEAVRLREEQATQARELKSAVEESRPHLRACERSGGARWRARDARLPDSWRASRPRVPTRCTWRRIASICRLSHVVPHESRVSQPSFLSPS